MFIAVKPPNCLQTDENYHHILYQITTRPFQGLSEIYLQYVCIQGTLRPNEIAITQGFSTLSSEVGQTSHDLSNNMHPIWEQTTIRLINIDEKKTDL